MIDLTRFTRDYIIIILWRIRIDLANHHGTGKSIFAFDLSNARKLTTVNLYIIHTAVQLFRLDGFKSITNAYATSFLFLRILFDCVLENEYNTKRLLCFEKQTLTLKIVR